VKRLMAMLLACLLAFSLALGTVSVSEQVCTGDQARPCAPDEHW